MSRRIVIDFVNTDKNDTEMMDSLRKATDELVEHLSGIDGEVEKFLHKESNHGGFYAETEVYKEVQDNGD